MSRKSLYSASSVILFFFFTTGFSADTGDVVFTQKAYGAIEAGQISRGYYWHPGLANGQPIAHVWQQRAIGNVGFNALVKKRLTINLTGEGLMAFSSPQIGRWPQTLQTRQFFYVKWAYASYPFGNIDAPFLTLQAGLFPYKYNPDARNLGEYMFRSNAYPLVIYSGFDYPLADLFGFRANVRFKDLLLKNDRLENDLILHSELLGVPVQDWSLSDVISYTIPGVTVGAGVSFSRFFSVYQGIYPPTATEPYFYPNNLSAQEKLNFYIRDTVGTDSVLFDWKAIKLMGRVSFDPKKIIPFDKFGKEDLKFYIETDIVGLKNYPLFFTETKDRMLTTFGFNFPQIKSIKYLPGISSLANSEWFNSLIDWINIDIVNLEFEHCTNKSAFSDGNLYGTPDLSLANIVPVDSFCTAGEYYIKRSPWRWSVYLKKSVLDDHVSFIAQVGRDHKKIDFYYFELAYMSFIESLQTKKDWWWTLKTEFKF
jgi:hypothetical protein